MFIQLLFSRELTWYCRQRSNQDRRRLSPSGFCNKNILNIIPSSSSMCMTNVIIALSYDFIWILIEDDTGCFRMGKPNWSPWTAPQPSSSLQLSRWQFWVETEPERFQLFSSGSPLPDRHQGLWAVWHSLHAALRRQKNRQCLWTAGQFQSWPSIYYTY